MDEGAQGDRFRILAERRIRDAIESGEFRVKTGPDQVLDLEENPYIEEDWRMVFHVLRNGHFRPDWMEVADEIDQDLAAWRQAADDHFRFLRERLEAATCTFRGTMRLREEVAALKLRHQRATAHHAEMIEEINRKIHRYNATVPAPGLMRGTILADEAMRRWHDRLPAYLEY
ncbi:MAG: DnaJ family domain-containing protein [Chloroflexia bacterium]